ncbi:MAG TPA: helix-turn-helix transcriptional regulator [Pseudolabrys sp.]|nr:helix-turn-helix transcriptional regulator [Pseudolabrys sp.]
MHDDRPKTSPSRAVAVSEADIHEDRFLAELGQRVRDTRALRGMSRKVLSRASGLSERYIAQLESGQGNVSIILLRRIAQAMGTRIDNLLPDNDASSDWLVLRDLLQDATPEQIAQVKATLSGGLATAASTQRVALIGLRGAGKSTLGRIAAQRIGWPFIELDQEIERAAGVSITEVFALYGQEGYRRLEQSELRRLIGEPGPMLIATGGGIVAEPLTFDLVLSSCFAIWLKASPEEHMQRVRDQGDLRPMRDDRSAMQELRAILLSREPLYARARAVVDTSGLDAETAAARLVDVIARNATAA